MLGFDLMSGSTRLRPAGDFTIETTAEGYQQGHLWTSTGPGRVTRVSYGDLSLDLDLRIGSRADLVEQVRASQLSIR